MFCMEILRRGTLQMPIEVPIVPEDSNDMEGGADYLEEDQVAGFLTVFPA